MIKYHEMEQKVMSGLMKEINTLSQQVMQLQLKQQEQD